MDQLYREKFHYEICVDWDLSVFKQISDILEDTTITEVSVQDSSYSYITPIKIKKTLSNIMDSIQLFYNQITHLLIKLINLLISPPIS